VSALAAQQGGVASSLARRAATACLAVVIVVGSAVLWIGVPVAGFWAGGRVTSNAQSFLLFVLGVVPVAMVLGGWALYRVSARYEALRRRARGGEGRSAWLVSLSDERAVLRRRRAGRPLIDVAMTASAVTAIVVMMVWFFLFATMRLAPLP
jgi:flagellar biosynthesis protein FliQ